MKDLLITHTDMDGISPIILMNLTNHPFEYKSIEIANIGEVLDELLKTNLKEYEHVYITDLTIPLEYYEKLKEFSNVLVFDHHETHLYANDYSFAEVKVTLNDRLTCATEIFFNYLKKIYKHIDTPIVRHYVDLVRQNDTWDYTDLEFAKKVGSLPYVYGRVDFIKSLTKRLKKDKEKLELTAFEKRYTKLQEEELERYLKGKEKKMERFLISNHKVGIVFAENHRSELGNYLSTNNPDLDLIIIINDCERISYRTTKDDVRVNDFAALYNGGGHQKASGSGMTEEDRFHIIEYYFHDVKRLEKPEN